MVQIDETHDPKTQSWVASANGHPDFPLQNLPLGIFSSPGKAARGGVAIGDQIFDIASAMDAGLFAGEALVAAQAAAGPTLNPLMALGAAPRRALRRRIFQLLSADGPDRTRVEALSTQLLHPASNCTLHLPAAIGDYTDFFAGIHHARNASRIFRPDTEPLLPSYKYVPVAYHGRASSVRPSGTAVRRPNGQRQPSVGGPVEFGPSLRLDHEFEFGIWIGTGNALGQSIPVSEAADHIFGFCLLNDWSARDIQAWEAQPLGPFLAKNFQTTISPWIVTPEALAPFRVPQTTRPEGDPRPLPHLWHDDDQKTGALDAELEMSLMTPELKAQGKPPQRLSLANTSDLYWTFAQMVAHHASGGCNLSAGDLFGSGTISAATDEGCGCFFEMTKAGREPVRLASGETRAFLEDGDEVIFHARCRREGYAPIGFGECRGVVLPALESGRPR